MMNADDFLIMPEIFLGSTGACERDERALS